MANIAHSVLAGTEIHEPKGVADASLGQVYVADGNGSGNWSNIGTSSFTGMIADFAWPEVQDGWLECDGSDINITTYGALFAVMTIQQNGTRTASSAVITSLTSTTPMKVGYYIYGAGIPEDTTILSVDSATQVTMSANASSTGTTTVIVSPWRMGLGVIRLPDLSTAGRYRRSKTSTTRVGQLQSSTVQAHTHTYSGTSGVESISHTHNVSGNTGTMSANVTHSHGHNANATTPIRSTNTGSDYSLPGLSAATISDANINHTHAININSGSQSVTHTHNYSGTTDNNGASTETTPVSIVLMTCVKT